MWSSASLIRGFDERLPYLSLRGATGDVAIPTYAYSDGEIATPTARNDEGRRLAMTEKSVDSSCHLRGEPFEPLLTD